MSLCRHFSNRYLPYLLIPFFAGIITFLTWITLSAAGASTAVTELAAILVFILIAGLMGVYLYHCQSRNHCDNS